MFPPRSIPPFGPPLDRLVIRAALAKAAGWPRDPEGLTALVAAELGRTDPGGWTALPEPALVAALRARADGPVAAPSWGRAQYAQPLSEGEVVWMDTAHHRLDPGRSEVAAALDAGARAVLMAPVAGDCASLLGVAELCVRRGVPLAVDARASAGGRVLDGPPGALGDLALVSVDGEPGPAPCPGAILFGADSPAPAPSSSRRFALDLLRESLRSEPRLRRLWHLSGADAPLADRAGGAPSWAFAAAAARLQQSATRASQRARHGKALRRSLSWIEGVDLPDEPAGVQSAGGALGLLIRNRDAVRERLTAMGIATVGGADWLAPEGARTGRSVAVAEQALLLPLLPFYRPKDLDHIGECLRRAALKAAADASA